METEACPVSRMTSTAAGSISSPSEPSVSAAVLPELPEPVFPLSAAFLSISAMTESEYSASLDALTKETTSCTSSSVIKQPCTRLGLPCPSGA